MCGRRIAPFAYTSVSEVEAAGVLAALHCSIEDDAAAAFADSAAATAAALRLRIHTNANYKIRVYPATTCHTTASYH